MKEKLVAVGDVVFSQVHEVNNKLALQFESPYHVLDHEHGNEIKVRHLTPYEVKVIHLDHVKRVSHSFDSSKELPALPSNSNTTDNTAVPNAPAAPSSEEYHKKLHSHTTCAEATTSQYP